MRRARLRGQLLDTGTAGRGVADVVSAVVGVQAQDGAAAALSVRARSTGLVASDVDTAIGETRSVVLTWSLRGTRHLHERGDVRWLLDLVGPVFGRPGRRQEGLGVAGAVGDEAVGALRHALAREGSLTRADVKRRLAPHGVDRSGQAAIHVIRRAALEGVLCVVPAPEGERYVLLDDWVPPGRPLGPEAAAAELARRYVAAYGPASPADFARWSGLGAPVTRRAWAAIGAELVELEEPRGAWITAAHRDEAEAAGRDPGPLRLLGAFDTLLLGYADRSALLAPEHAGRVSSGGGLIRPVVLADGEVVGTWAYRRGQRPPHVVVAPFRPLGPRAMAALERESADVGRFLGTGPLPTALTAWALRQPGGGRDPVL